MHGRAEVEIVDGVVEEYLYLKAARKNTEALNLVLNREFLRSPFARAHSPSAKLSVWNTSARYPARRSTG